MNSHKMTTFRQGKNIYHVVTSVMIMALVIFGMSIAEYKSGDTLFCGTALAVEAPTTDVPIWIASTIKPLAKLIASDNPSLKDALKILNTKEYVPLEGYASLWISINKDGYTIHICMMPDSTDRINEINIYTPDALVLRMKHITDALGPIRLRKYYRQKSYSTIYGHYRPDTDVLSYIRIHTLTVPSDPNSPVLSIKIRRDEKPDPETLKHILLIR